MSYLESLKETKKAREDYEDGVQELKKLVMEMEVLYNKYDGHFLTTMQDFINNYKKQKK